MTEQLPRVEVLNDGQRVRLRVGRPDDRDELVEAFDHLSPESRYRRFFSAMPRLTEDLLDRLTDVDAWHHVAVAAERIEPSSMLPRGLGVARFVRSKSEPHVAEIAVTVIDEVQNRGLGRILVRTLAEVARERGIRKLRATVLSENGAMLALLRKLAPNAEARMEDGAWVDEISLDSLPGPAGGPEGGEARPSGA
jgi:GNAT superfamily N-acetyltransferase